MAKKIRLTIDLTPEAYAALCELQEGIDVGSKSDVFRLSIKAFASLLLLHKEGWELSGRRGEETALLIFAGFPPLRR